MLRVGNTGSWFPINRHQPHQAHKAADPLYARTVSHQSQIVPHLAYAEKRPLCKGLIDLPHQHMVYAMFALGRILQAGAGNTE